MIDVTRPLATRAAVVWDLLIDTTVWPAWGPTVRAVELSGGGRWIGPQSTGRVATAVGIWLPFEVTAWEDGRRWAWRVGRIAATAHRVEPQPDDPGACRATIEVPLWAPAYTPVCWLALGRIGRLATTPDR